MRRGELPGLRVGRRSLLSAVAALAVYCATPIIAFVVPAENPSGSPVTLETATSPAAFSGTASASLSNSSDEREGTFRLDSLDSSQVALRVRHGADILEVPITFHEVRPEARGFWTDVAGNGFAIFFASALLLVLKEALGIARKRQLRVAQQLRLREEALRIERLNAELRESDERVSALEASGKRRTSPAFREEVRDVLWRVGRTRSEVLSLDAPAALALADSLVSRARDLLLKSRTVGAEWGRHSEGSEEEAPLKTEAEARGGTETLLERDRQDGGVGREDEEEADKDFAEQGLSSDIHDEPFPKKPDLELVRRVIKENPGMQPQGVIALALRIQNQTRGREDTD